MNENDRLRFEHMRQYALLTLEIIAGSTRDDLNNDIRLRFALIRAVEVIGEAASRVSPEAQATYPTIPWPPIISMRNRLIHGYFEINLDILWDTAKKEVPHLLQELSSIIPPDES
jgi:uncharacterized protein with HEPN domain